jgi:pentatricopeptide repeat protein
VDGADEALKMLQIVKQYSNDTLIHMQATIWVLEAYSKSFHGAVQCDELLQELKLYNTSLTTPHAASSLLLSPPLPSGYEVAMGRQLFDAEVYSNSILAWSKAATSAVTIGTTTDEANVLLPALDSNDDAGSDTLSMDMPKPLTPLSPPTNATTDIQPDATIASTALANPEFGEQAAENAHRLLLELVDHYLKGSFERGSEPPLIAFNGVISAYSRLGRIDQAEEMLWLMERQVRPTCEQLIPNAISYNSILHGIYRQSQLPHSTTHRNHHRKNKNWALRKALSIVTYMEENSDEQPTIRPNAFSYQTVLKCWLQNTNDNYSREHIAEQAEQLLYKVEHLWAKGDTSLEYTNRIYNMVLNAFAKTYNGKRFLSSKAMDLLSRMKQSTHNQCQPDIISYTSTLECLAQSSDPMASELADELLQEVKMRYATTNALQLRPNLRTYTMTIQALARNNGNIVRARELLTELVQQYEQSGYDPQLKPNTFPYNYVLNCAANTMNPDKRLQAFQIATQTYQEMRKSNSIHPDSYSYAFWFKCCNNLLDPGALRTKGIMYAFEECKRDGLVSDEVLTRLIQGCPNDVVTSLLDVQPPSINPTTLAVASTESDTNANRSVDPTVTTSLFDERFQPNFIQQRRFDRNQEQRNSIDPFTSISFRSSTTSMNSSGLHSTLITENHSTTTAATATLTWTIRDLPSSWSRNIGSKSRKGKAI